MRKREKRKRKRTDWRKDGRESRLCGRLSVIYIHIDAWEKLATFLRGHRHHSPCPSSTPPSSSFSNGLPSPRAASSPAINTKNSQGQTAPPRFIAYEFSDLSIAATCLSPVTADPHLPSRASVSSAASRSGATYFPGTNAMNHACPRYECSSADIRSGCSGHDPRLLDIVHFHPVVSIRFSEGTNGVSFVRKRLNRIYLEMDGYSLLRGRKIH